MAYYVRRRAAQQLLFAAESSGQLSAHKQPSAALALSQAVRPILGNVASPACQHLPGMEVWALGGVRPMPGPRPAGAGGGVAASANSLSSAMPATSCWVSLGAGGAGLGFALAHAARPAMTAADTQRP